jgi:hypothetical protein
MVVGKALDALTEGAKFFPGARMVTGANAALTARSATDVGGALVPAAPKAQVPAAPLGLAAVPPGDERRRD